MTTSLRPFDEADQHAFVDGQMDVERRAAFLRLLSSNSELKTKIDGWKAQNEAMMATFGPVLYEPVPVRLMPTNVSRDRRRPDPIRLKSAMPADLTTPAAPGVRPDGAPRSRFVVVFAAFVAGALTVFGAVQAGVVQRQPDHIALSDAGSVHALGLAQRAYEAHETYATDLNRPVEIPAVDEGRLLKWIQHRMAMPVRIPRLQKDGWSLIGGRVIPGDLGPAAFLIYGNGVERLGLYMARTNSSQNDGYAIADNGSGLASVAYWVNEPIGYALTTSRDAQWLDRNAPDLYHTISAQSRDTALSE